MPLIFAILASILLSACSMPEAPKRTALVYGMSIYAVTQTEGTYPNLTLTDDDALSMAEMLTANGWTVARAGIANTQVESESQDATKAAIAADIAALKGTEGQVLFYYSGHGMSSGGVQYLCPFGSVVVDGGYVKTIPSAMITPTELYAMFESAGLENVIIMLDSCYSGGFVSEGATVDAVPPLYGVNDIDVNGTKGDIKYTWFVDSIGDAVTGYIGYSASSDYVVISAAGAGDLSWESGIHGIFTKYILAAGDGRKNADLDGDGYVSTGELYAYCAVNIMHNWNDTYDDVYSDGQYADYYPHVSGTAHEYALWATN